MDPSGIGQSISRQFDNNQILVFDKMTSTNDTLKNLKPPQLFEHQLKKHCKIKRKLYEQFSRNFKPGVIDL